MLSVLTKLAALRMEEAEVLRTECATCGHPLRQHPLSRHVCQHFDVVRHASGDPERARLKYCKCREFVE